jgi:flavin reductase (DIM6/NTAB) family NADH-FMN oxidoreductase RutF
MIMLTRLFHSGGIVNRSGMDVSPGDLRMGMRYWATGVTVVTTEFQGIVHGMTVSSFTSVSLTPPLILVALERKSRTHEIVEQSGIFGVNILADDQREVSDRFAGRHTEYTDRFKNLDVFTLATGSPMLLSGLASFDCQVTATHPGGTHTIFIGQVVASQINHEQGEPLIYFNRDYHRLADLS